MTPPRRDPLDEARRSLDEAAGALDGMRRLTGASQAPDAQAMSASEGVRREALAAARDELRRVAAELEAARARGATLLEEVGRLREELAARPTARDLEAANAAGESNATRRAAELALQVVGLKERVSLLSAEHVRLETLRRKAEAFGANAEASRCSMEETLRRDLRAAHEALDRAAAESGTRDAKAVSEIEDMRKRLDHALNRVQREDRENLARKQKNDESASFRSDLETAQAVIVSLRRELSEQRADALGRESALALRVHELERRLTEALSPRGAALLEEIGRLREELAARPATRELEEARAAAASLRRDLSAANAALEEVGRLREELASRPSLLELKEARAAEETLRRDLRGALSTLEEVRRLREELAARPQEFEVKDALAEAERLKLDAQAARSALAQAAAESAAREAKAASELEVLRNRLDREDLSKAAAEAAGSSLRNDLLAAQGIIASLRRELAELRAGARDETQGAVASLRRELSEQRAEALERERALDREAADLRTREAQALAEIETMRKLLDKENLARQHATDEESSFRNDLVAALGVITGLRRELAEQRADALAGIELGAAAGEPELREAVEYPPMEFTLEPGWAKLFRIVKPPLQAAYGHLRRLSAGPMSAGQRAILRLTGASLSQAADSLATIELALADSPATTETSPLLPVLEAALAAWDAVFRRRGISLTRDFSRTVLDSPHDPEQLRLALHHVLRNAVEALPRGATLRVHFRKSAAGAAEIEFRDDGPGYPAAWLERQFEPFVSPRQGHAGLGLAAVRRALRRWGGDALAAAAGADGRGACLTLAFAAAPARPVTKS